MEGEVNGEEENGVGIQYHTTEECSLFSHYKCYQLTPILQLPVVT